MRAPQENIQPPKSSTGIDTPPILQYEVVDALTADEFYKKNGYEVYGSTIVLKKDDARIHLELFKDKKQVFIINRFSSSMRLEVNAQALLIDNVRVDTKKLQLTKHTTATLINLGNNCWEVIP